jgi:hypothetical protein
MYVYLFIYEYLSFMCLCMFIYMYTCMDTSQSMNESAFDALGKLNVFYVFI